MNLSWRMFSFGSLQVIFSKSFQASSFITDATLASKFSCSYLKVDYFSSGGQWALYSDHSAAAHLEWFSVCIESCSWNFPSTKIPRFRVPWWRLSLQAEIFFSESVTPWFECKVLILPLLPSLENFTQSLVLLRGKVWVTILVLVRWISSRKPWHLHSFSVSWFVLFGVLVTSQLFWCCQEVDVMNLLSQGALWWRCLLCQARGLI